MPLFVPVPPEQREDVLNRVAEMLHALFRKGYLYKEVRWQHVVRRVPNGSGSEMVLALLDMGSLLDMEFLKKLNPTELAEHDLGPFLNRNSLRNIDEVIQKQVEQLRSRIPEESPGSAEVPGSLLAPA